MTPPAFIADCVARAVDGRPRSWSGVRPVTDTVKQVDGGFVGEQPSTAPSSGRSPPRSCCPPPVVAALDSSSDSRLRRPGRRAPVATTASSWSRPRPSPRRVVVGGRRTPARGARLAPPALTPGRARLTSSGKVIFRFAGRGRDGGDPQVGVPLQAAGGVGALEAVRRRPPRRPRAALRPGTPEGSAPPTRSPSVDRSAVGADGPRTKGYDGQRAAVLARGRDRGREQARRRPAAGPPSWTATTSIVAGLDLRRAAPGAPPTPRRAGSRRPRRPRTSPSPRCGVHGRGHGVLLAGPGHEQHPANVRPGPARSAADQASTGALAERQQHLVDLGADPRAGCRRRGSRRRRTRSRT